MGRLGDRSDVKTLHAEVLWSTCALLPLHPRPRRRSVRPSPTLAREACPTTRLTAPADGRAEAKRAPTSKPPPTPPPTACRSLTELAGRRRLTSSLQGRGGSDLVGSPEEDKESNIEDADDSEDDAPRDELPDLGEQAGAVEAQSVVVLEQDGSA